MKPAIKIVRQKRRGAALILSMIFVLIFSALAVGVATMSGTNVQIASNQHKINRALANAESGMQVMRYWLSRVLIPASTPTSQYLSTITSTVQNDLAANNITNFVINNDGNYASIPSVMLDSTTGQTFEGRIQISPSAPLILPAFVTGTCGEITRTIRVNYNIKPYEYPIFDYGLATKGPVHFLGNPTITGINSNKEADIFIDSQNINLAMRVTGNTNFDGDISIGNSNGITEFGGDIKIGGDTGQTAIDNHITTGVETPEFPLPDTQHFLQYATGAIIDSSTNVSHHMTLTNARIAAGTDPNFLGNITINGILYIEQPNIVRFSRNVALNGMIVGDGNAYTPGTNSISFCGNFATYPYPPGAEFDAIRSETGSSIVAPGFSASFSGNFAALGGVMAVSGAHFSGNVNAVVKGTIINYSENPIVIEGNSTMNFDRSDNIKVPAGFDLYRVLDYNTSSYSEVIL